MKQPILIGLCLIALATGGAPALADEPTAQSCLECHEPAADWAGMSVEEIMVQARNPDNKRHVPNRAISDEQLKVIIMELMGQ
jgi:hypothetical protein